MFDQQNVNNSLENLTPSNFNSYFNQRNPLEDFSYNFDRSSESIDNPPVYVTLSPTTIEPNNNFAIAKKYPPTKTIDLDESWSFQINDYAIEHQGNAVIDINVSYDYIDGIGVPDPLQYPDFVPIEKYIKNFLVNYPNETDFWEVLNKNLVTSLLTEPIPTPYGIDYKLANVLDSLTIKIDVEAGSSNINIPRSSIVTGKPQAISYQ
jgi:hypothetical protein